ncbi:hypothetical protein N7488_002982 [Penicillium malachiteum]|nr:hypothetical protein N7488_002982 [Penicillium malachiteum]
MASSRSMLRLNLKGLPVPAMPRLYQSPPPARFMPLITQRLQWEFVSTRPAISKKPDRPAQTEQEHHEVDMNTLSPSDSFESLGIGKSMRLFLFAVFGVLGTIETWFWCKAIWIWWKNEDSSMD